MGYRSYQTSCGDALTAFRKEQMTKLLEAERATELLAALRKHILGGGTLICGYNQASEMIGLSDNHSKVTGQICSRIDLFHFQIINEIISAP